MNKTAIVLSCAHADPSADNKRFDWLGRLIYDINPNYIVDLGDGADMRSLNTYDTTRPQAIVTQNYEKDIDVYNEAMDRMRIPSKARKYKRPAWFGFEGNHEHRIKKAIQQDPRLEGSRLGVSFSHLQTDHWFEEYHEYHNSAPALFDYDGVIYGHYVSSGNFGTAMSTKHHGYSLVEKLASSATVGHTHKFIYFFKGDARPSPLHGLVVGCYKGKEEAWAGQANQEWRRGVVIKREISQGDYDLEWVSMARLEKEYST